MKSLIKDDKGTWIINSKMIVEPKGEDMEARGWFTYK